MKYLNLLILFFVILLTSCNGGEPPLPYAYNTNPRYTWGYTQYFAKEYTTFGINNNILSVSLFSDSLSIDSLTKGLVGTGQFLFLEDIFVSPFQTTLTAGTYTINSSGLPYTVSPGKNDTVGTEIFPIGATISYYEENSSKSKLKFITEGTFRVTKSLISNTITIIFDLKTDDKKTLKGSYAGKLEYYDESLTLQRMSAQLRTRGFTRL